MRPRPFACSLLAGPHRRGPAAWRSPPHEDDGDEDNWEAIEPDPAELDDWDETLGDDDLDYEATDDDGWPGDQPWPDFDRGDEDEED